MAVTNTVGNAFNEEYINGEHDLTSNDIMAILVNGMTFNQTTHIAYNAAVIALEVASGNGYTTAGEQLTTPTLDQVTNVMTFNADNVTWTAESGSIGPATGCLIYNDTHANKTTICYIDFGGAYTATVGTALTVDLSSGIVTWTANPA